MEVTTRSAANVMGIHPNSAALFYHKLREIIAVRIADDVPFDGEIEVDESYFGGVRKGKRGRGVAGKCLFLDCSNGEVKAMLCRCRIHQVIP